MDTMRLDTRTAMDTVMDMEAATPTATCTSIITKEYLWYIRFGSVEYEKNKHEIF